MKIGNAISTLRKRKGISQFDFAKQCGISQTSLSQIELEKKRPNPKNLEKICTALGVPEAFLYFLSFSEEDIPESKRGAYKNLAPILKTLIEQFVEEENLEKNKE